MRREDIIDRAGIQVVDGFASIPEAFCRLRARGIGVVEINLHNPYYLAELASSRQRKEIARAAKGERMTWMAHLPEGMSFFSLEEEVFARYLVWLSSIQEMAREAECRALTIHIGAAPPLAWSGIRRQATDIFGDFFRSILPARLNKAADISRQGPPICFENVAGFHQQFVRDTMDEIQGLSYTLDIGHLKVAHPRIAHPEWEFFKRHSERIRVVHLHDNDGEWDAHQPVTELKNLEPYLGLAKKLDAYLIMEVRPLEAAYSSLQALTGVKR